MREWDALEGLVVVDLALQDEVDDASELLGDEGAGVWLSLCPGPLLIEGSGLRVVLHRPVRRAGEGEFQVAVPWCSLRFTALTKG